MLLDVYTREQQCAENLHLARRLGWGRNRHPTSRKT